MLDNTPTLNKEGGDTDTSRNFTVIYTTNPCGTLVHTKMIRIPKPFTFAAALSLAGIDLSQVVQVFHGHMNPITSDWSKL